MDLQIHNDDISNVLILNKKSISGQESQLFDAELEKFRPHQTRLLQANHKQSSLMKELTKTYGDLLQDKRVRAEQMKYEGMTRQRNAVMARYKKVYEAFNGVSSGIGQARTFYKEMGDNVDSLRKNVETFINNRRSEGAQLLSQIERDKASGASEQEDREREKLRQLMERLSTEPKPSSNSPSTGSAAPPKIKSPPPPPQVQTPSYPSAGPGPKMSPRYPPTMTGPPPHGVPMSHSPAPYGQYMVPGQHFQQGAAAPLSEGYNPMAYPYQTPVSPPPNQQFFSQTPTPYGYTASSPPPGGSAGAPPSSHYMSPQGYIPPPPPPRPQQTSYPPSTGGPYPSGAGGYAQTRPYPHHRTPSQSQSQTQQQPSGANDPWAGLNAWK